MANDFRTQTEAGHQAKVTVIAYVDWLVSTINDAHPQENRAVPSPHPLAV